MAIHNIRCIYTRRFYQELIEFIAKTNIHTYTHILYINSKVTFSVRVQCFFSEIKNIFLETQHVIMVHLQPDSSAFAPCTN